MPDASTAPDHSPPRRSRQELVLPPRPAGWPVAVAALASAAGGFALVLFLGIGRSRPTNEAVVTEPAVAATADSPDGSPGLVAARFAQGPAVDEPGLLPPADDLAPPPSDRWAPRRGGEQPADDDQPAERYPAKPVSHDAATESFTAGRGGSPSSRFSSPDLPPLAEEPSEPADDPEPAAVPAEIPPPAAEARIDAESGEDAGPPPEAATVEPPLPALDEAPAPTPPAPRGPESAESRAAAAPPQPGPGPSFAAAEVPPVAEDAAAPPRVEPPAVPLPLDVPAPAPQALPPLPFPREASPPARLGPGDSPPAPGGAVPVSAGPLAAGPPLASPFASAPPLGPAPMGRVPGGGPPPGLEGHGVPGPLQLEGVQAPQLAVEKRGPREIQVGKPARYEILVRNVGSATAHEVTLRDAIPRGTSLIATTPPASPDPVEPGGSSDLVWALGVLPPGGEARVMMELMPEQEGDIGSVASVSFRAEATLRSRATKPELLVECRPPEPVRIGGDVQLTISVSNPGSGDATGVVLEAFLPDTVSHRAGGELEFDVGLLRSGESKTIELLLGTRSPGSQPARFVARADGGIEVDRPLPIPVTAPTLAVAIDMPSRRFLQRPATCAIKMVNSGTASARSVELAAQLPPGVKFVRANNAGWHDERTHRVLWNLEELPAGETGTVEVVVMPVQPGEQRITAAARSADGPSDQAVHACQVEGLAALAFQVADSEDPIEVGGVTEYVVRVGNEGTKAASGVRLAATLLGDLEPVEAEGPGRYRLANLTFEFEPLAKLGPGEEVVYRIRARGGRAGHQRVQVQLVSDDNPAPITREEVTSFYDDR